MPNEAAEILKLMKDNECDILDLKFTDLPGTWQHFSVPIGQVDDSLVEKGVGFDGSSIRGFQSIDESDMLIVPDPSTAKVDPFHSGTVTCIADIRDPITSESYSRDPRNIAKKAEKYLQSTGIGDTSFWGPEVEFFFFDSVQFDYGSNFAMHKVDSDEGIWNSGAETMLDGQTLNKGYRPRHKEGYFPASPVDTAQELRSEMVRSLVNDFGLVIEAQHHEVATGGQAEIDMKYDSLLKTADSVMMYK
ncbi:MAG: hypothetical protein CM1200mP3_15870 [Chloroflexota bacterium]|nr:MAG: hypothetical protein CM1200mP3_15870 [Chloroflexota bacterium]